MRLLHAMPVKSLVNSTVTNHIPAAVHESILSAFCEEDQTEKRTGVIKTDSLSGKRFTFDIIQRIEDLVCVRISFPDIHNEDNDSAGWCKWQHHLEMDQN